MSFQETDVLALATLANSDLQTALAARGIEGVSDSALAAAMATAVAEENDANIKASAVQILALKKKAVGIITNNTANILALQSQIGCLNAASNGIDRAVQYGDATRNYLPLAAATGSSVRGLDSVGAALAVPKDWTPTPVAAAV